MRAFVFVIDGFGIGEMGDAKLFGDEKSNTFGNILKKMPVNIPFMKSLGFNNIDGVSGGKVDFAAGAFGRMAETVMAKDTTAGHWEMMGVQIEKPFVVFENGVIPEKLVLLLEKEFGIETLCKKAFSGTQLIAEYGEEHIKTGKPIIYTSTDSVLQIACHDKVFSIEKLNELCEKARAVCQGEFAVGRVIARPFGGEKGAFYRRPERKDFSIIPPENVMTKVVDAGQEVVAIGKIHDIFAEKGITRSFGCKTNKECLEQAMAITSEDFSGLIFVNLIETDMLFGHRNDVEGYAKCLEKTDVLLQKMRQCMKKDDVLFISADHGNDPTTESTNHSREFVPLLICGESVLPNVQLGTLQGFDHLGATVLEILGIEEPKKSLWKKIGKTRRKS